MKFKFNGQIKKEIRNLRLILVPGEEFELTKPHMIEIVKKVPGIEVIKQDKVKPVKKVKESIKEDV